MLNERLLFCKLIIRFTAPFSRHDDVVFFNHVFIHKIENIKRVKADSKVHASG